MSNKKKHREVNVGVPEAAAGRADPEQKYPDVLCTIIAFKEDNLTSASVYPYKILY
jgi:hypothetical protein